MKELQATLGFTYEQLRARVTHLKANFEGVAVDGKRGKWLVTDMGITLLKRFKELEQAGHSFDSATTVIKEELDSSDQKEQNTTSTDTHTTTTPPPDNPNDQIVRDAFEVLKKQLEEKDKEIERLHDLLNRQLPPVSEGRKSRWGYLKSVFTG